MNKISNFSLFPRSSFFDESHHALIFNQISISTHGHWSFRQKVHAVPLFLTYYSLGTIRKRDLWVSDWVTGKSRCFYPAALGKREETMTLEPRGRERPKGRSG